MENKLRVVLVGCGGMSGTWLQVASQMDTIELVGLVDIREEAARRRAKDFDLDEELGKSGGHNGRFDSVLLNLKN